MIEFSLTDFYMKFLRVSLFFIVSGIGFVHHSGMGWFDIILEVDHSRCNSMLVKNRRN